MAINSLSHACWRYQCMLQDIDACLPHRFHRDLSGNELRDLPELLFANQQQLRILFVYSSWHIQEPLWRLILWFSAIFISLSSDSNSCSHFSVFQMEKKRKTENRKREKEENNRHDCLPSVKPSHTCIRDLSDNKLTSVPGPLFSDLFQLQELYVKYRCYELIFISMLKFLISFVEIYCGFSSNYYILLIESSNLS
jgi:hypothetical protein